MTMQHPTHPDDERLAALADGDSEVASDGALRAHVDSCDRCTDLVRELASLRSALGELPDLVPPRPLQLLPPVAEPQTAARGGWLRRLAAPAMAAGFVLVVAGAIGSSGFSLGMASSGAAPAFENAGDGLTGGAASSPAASDAGQAPGVPSPLTARPHRTSAEGHVAGSVDQHGSRSPKAQPVPAADRGNGETGLFATADPRLPWLVVLGLGVGLLLAGIVQRFAQQPGAG